MVQRLKGRGNRPPRILAFLWSPPCEVLFHTIRLISDPYQTVEVIVCSLWSWVVKYFSLGGSSSPYWELWSSPVWRGPCGKEWGLLPNPCTSFSYVSEPFLQCSSCSSQACRLFQTWWALDSCLQRRSQNHWSESLPKLLTYRTCVRWWSFMAVLWLVKWITDTQGLCSYAVVTWLLNDRGGMETQMLLMKY